VRRPTGRCPSGIGVIVLDLVYIIGVIAAFALVAVIGKAVERL
jgi:hypothetical protein